MSKLTDPKVVKIKKGDVTIHCYISPDDGEAVNAQLIETQSKLVVIDTLLLKPYAKKLREYCNQLGKMIERVIITHSHPDHWFGLEYFSDVPVYALAETQAEIQKSGDYLLGYHRSLHGEKAEALIPAQKTVPANILTNGAVDIDGVKIEFIKITDAETRVMLAVELPMQHTLLAQDLLYNGIYLFVGDKMSNGEWCFDSWKSHLESLQTKGYKTVIPGHGDPGDFSLFADNINYLKRVKKWFEEVENGDELKVRIQKEYPDWRVPLMLDMSNYFLYAQGQGKK